MKDNLSQIVAHGRTEYATANLIVSQHQPHGYGLCHCGRIWECSVHIRWSAYARYWQARLDALEPRLAALTGATLMLPTL